MGILIILVVILVYAISVYASYKFIQASHSKDGRWSNLKPDGSDLFVTITPILNTFFFIIAWVFMGAKKEKDLSKFFKTK